MRISSTNAAHPRIIPAILQQHIDDAASLQSLRSRLVRAPHVRLQNLRGFDDRLSAHLEGLSIAGAAARPMCDESLAVATPARIFVAAMHALASGDPLRLSHLLALCESMPECLNGLICAFGWAERTALRGVVTEYLDSEHALEREIGLAACSLHRVDPGRFVTRHLEDESPTVRARAWRLAGELGKRELVSSAALTMNEDPTSQFWASWAAVVLGDRRRGLEAIGAVASSPGPFRARAFQLTLLAMDSQIAHRWLTGLARDSGEVDWLIRGAGFAGDPKYIPWLIEQMAVVGPMRRAAEAFCLITGLDVAWSNLDRPRPADFESGPNDDPNDSDVGMDEDDGLPWPDAAKIQAWWHANSHRFQSGVRYFMGQPLNRENCVRVLKEGFQRQRIAAALYLSLLNPGTPLFEWRAPARRQQRLLAEMT